MISPSQTPSPAGAKEPVAVLGAGVVGLSTAILALKAGHPVTVYSSLPWDQTTSTKAAASFKPHKVAYNDLAHRMLIDSWERFARLLSDAPDARHGVRLHTHWETAHTPNPVPPYRDVVQDFAQLEGDEVPGDRRYGWRYTTFFIDTTLYLPWLVAQLQRLGGGTQVLASPLRHLDDLAALPEPVVFNCCGLGARRLCGDYRVRPLKGQILLIDPIPGMDWSIAADDYYVYPRRHDTVIGGTAEPDVWTEEVDPDTRDRLIQGNRPILPGLDLSRVRSSYAGLRPYRDESVRLELEQVGQTAVVHNYGHGGAGVTLSWGSAALALDLVS